MAKRAKKTGGRNRPPVRYKRSMSNMVKVKTSLGGKRIKTGMLLEFSYGKRQTPGKVGGWKHDPIPRILVFYDDGDRYVEGLNTNYLSDYYMRKLKTILSRFPGIDGDELYLILKRTAMYAIKKGYRKYLRSSIRNEYVYMYEDELLNHLDPTTPEDEGEEYDDDDT